MRTFAMIAALAACGTINSPGGGSDDDSGGSGSGSDMEPPHPPGTLYGHVKDERGDTIDFSTNEPVHTHAGASIDLSMGCPAVYKYSYLMDEQSPVFGRQTTTNPLAWHVMTNVGSLDASATAYRVRADNGAVLLDWTATSPDASGLYTIELHRNGSHPIPALGMQAGKMYVDVRFRDTAGNETVDSACWEHHPLAVPLQLQQLQPETLFGMSLPADSAISMLMRHGVYAYSTRVFQYAGEPVTITLDGALPTGHYLKTWVDDYVLDSTVTATDASTMPCGDSPCPTGTPIDPPDVTDSGALDNAVWQTMVIDEATGSVGLPLSWTIPARAASEPPHSYQVVFLLEDLDQLQAPASMITTLTEYDEYPVASQVYTGLPSSETATNCLAQGHRTLPQGLGVFFWCTNQQRFKRIVALDRLRIDFDPVTFTAMTTPGADVQPTAVGTVGIGAMTWDAGDDGI